MSHELSGKHGDTERLRPFSEYFLCLKKSSLNPSLCQVLLIFHTPMLCSWRVFFPWVFHQLLRKKQVSQENLTNPKSGVTWGPLTPPLMAKALLSGRACWASSCPHTWHHPWAPTLVPRVLWKMEPGQEHKASEQIGAAPHQPANLGRGHLREEYQGNGALKPDGVERRGQSLSKL